jgi:glyoxylase-like metal-dependent hydrolase (beta-lactamase superfamily II)
VVLIDCGLVLSAVRRVRNELEEATGQKVETVVLTHFHSDHTRALPAFSDCRIISSDTLFRNLKQAGRKAPKGFRLAFPSEAFSSQLEVQDGGIQLVIKQTGGHTDCSTYVFCPEYRSLVAGDNLWTQYYPWGGARGCDPDVWIRVLREYLSLDADCFIPGHGPVGGRDDVTLLLEYLTRVRTTMKEVIVQGGSDDEVIRAGGEIKYYPTGEGCPHISTLKKWCKI